MEAEECLPDFNTAEEETDAMLAELLANSASVETKPTRTTLESASKDALESDFVERTNLSSSNLKSSASSSDSASFSYPPEVESALSSAFPSADPLDSAEFELVSHINSLFPTEQSLSHLDEAMTELRDRSAVVDADLRRSVGGQDDDVEGQLALNRVQNNLAGLFNEMRIIKKRASESESSVRDLTRDIKRLDVAKRNLTSAISTLNHLHMLVGGGTTLKEQTEARQYGDAALLLQALSEVQLHFGQSYKAIPQIGQLASRLEDIKNNLAQQIVDDFKEALQLNNNEIKEETKVELAEACLVANVLGGETHQSILRLVTQQQLSDYETTFEESNLDRVESRYNWLKRRLVHFEETHMADIVPIEWNVSENVARHFCKMTRVSLERLLKNSSGGDPTVLMQAIHKTVAFEALLDRRFFDEEEEESSDDKSDGINKGRVEAIRKSNRKSFKGLISGAFEQHLNVLLDFQSSELTELVDQAAVQAKNNIASSNNEKSANSLGTAREEASVLHSCGDLFLLYKKFLVQVSQLSTGMPLVQLSQVFRKHLSEYASKVLMANLPRSKASSSSSVMTALVSKASSEFSGSARLLQNFQGLLRDQISADILKLGDSELGFVCSFLLTAEYCLETTQQLEAKLKEKAEKEYRHQIDFVTEQDAFLSVVNACVEILVQQLELTCEPALSVMVKMSWSTLEIVGDQSAYVTSIANHMKHFVPLIRAWLASSRKYFTLFCTRFATVFTAKFLQHLYKCKPASSSQGAEQLLLDTHSLKTLLLELPNFGSDGGQSNQIKKAPANYTKIIVKAMTHAEMTVKVVMSSRENVESFVTNCQKLLPEMDAVELQKIMDMQGIRKVDQTPYLEHFRSLAPAKKQTSSPVAHKDVVGQNGSEEGRIKRLENMIKKRL